MHIAVVKLCSVSETWTQMPDYPNKKYSSLVVIEDVLTAIGGIDKYRRDSNKLCSLKREGKTQQWIEEFRPMPTERSLTTAICTESSLIVAGGLRKGERLATVEVMDKESCQWSTAARLPQPIHRASASICCDRIYLLGAGVSKSVHSCLLSELLRSCQETAHQSTSSTANVMWSNVADLPVSFSTSVSLCGHLLACLLYTSPSPRDATLSRMPSSA